MDKRVTRWINLLIPICSVLLGFLLGAIVMVIFDYNPIAGYRAMFEGSLGSPYYIGETLRQATPLIFTALGFSVASAAGFFNIGLAGQALAGWLISVMVALSFPDLPKPVLLPLAIIAGTLAGALYAAIPGYLRAYFGTSEVIVTIMLNYTMLYISNHMVRNVLTENLGDSTPSISENATLRMQSLSSWTGGSNLNGGLYLALVALVLVWFVMHKTTLGFEIRSVGLNPFASEYAGMSSKKNIILSMVISGGLAGLGGVCEGLGTYNNLFVLGSAPAIGFDGMAVSLLGAGTSFGIFISAILFAILKIGGLSMPLSAGVPKEIVDIVIAAIIFFVGANYLIRYFLEKPFQKKKPQVATTIMEDTTFSDDDHPEEGGRL